MKGLTKGISLIGLAWNMRRRAVLKGNSDLVAALDAVMTQFVTELFKSSDVQAKDVNLNWFALLLGADPFSQSRQLFQAVQAKWPGA